MVSKQPLMCFSLLLFLLLSLQTKCSEGCLEQERFALLQLQPFFDDPYGYINWVEVERNSDCCQWEWVQCNQTTGRVISIGLSRTRNEDLGEWYLNASLFSPFKELQILALWHNQIAGCVENEGFDKLSTLRNLEVLDLYSNNFNNSILSSISTLSSLKTLDLSYNKGIVNLQDLRLSNLEVLDLSRNNLNNSILSSLTGLSSLKIVYLYDTGLKGTIDLSELFDSLNNLEWLDMSNNQINKIVVRKDLRLSNLEFMDLSGNNLNNSILSSLTGLSTLRTLYLFDSGLKGIVDLSELFDSLNNLERLDIRNNQINKIVVRKGLRLSNLEIMDLSGNNLNNSILSSLTGLSTLRTLYLYDNGLKGTIDLSDLRLSDLEDLSLNGNNLNNSILSSLTGLSSLKGLSLYDTGLKGTIDLSELFDSLNHLEELDMRYNQINKIMVSKDLRLSNLEFMDLSGNNLNNSILSSLIGLSTLRILYLNDNGLKGTVDLSELFDSLNNLEFLEMSNNQINKIVVRKDKSAGVSNLTYLGLGNVSIHDGSALLQSLGSFPSLNGLGLGYNNLSGMMSTGDLSNLKNLKLLNMEGSNLDTSILQSIGMLTSLEALSLQNCSLEGTIPDQGLCELLPLEVLDLSDNDLRGALPSCFANLTSLQQLDLSNNHFQIPISLEPFFNISKLKDFTCENNDLYSEEKLHFLAPKFQLNSIILSGCKGSCSFPKFLYHQHDLQVVDLSHNNFTGEFPNWLLENNTRLQHLVLVNNSLTRPLQLSNHSHVNLMTLDISMNRLNGHIPVEVGAYLPGLTILNISRNALEGTIPYLVGDMNSLISLDLSYNQLSGEIPEHLAESCIQLQLLVLSNNSLQGQIFSTNFSLIKLQSLQLDGNRFSGEIPDSLSNTSLMGLYLSDNEFSGKIPSWLGNMSSLIEIVMPNNKFEGPIPPDFCHLKHLEVLNLAGNSISDIPSCFSPSSLRQVHLSRNKLQGELQDSFHNSSSLVTLDLGYNHINGSIPKWIGMLSNLTYLILNNNNLQGRVPIQLCQLDQLRLIDLSHNNLVGHIPPCLMSALCHRDYIVQDPSYYEKEINETAYPLMGKEEAVEFRTKTFSYFYHGKILSNMSGIDLSCNKLSGVIPFQIGNLTMIHALNLSHNNLTGPIPPTFSNLKQIESLDLSHNNLNGEIPHQLVELYYLEVFSVAYNNLSGRTLGVAAQFISFDESSYEGNPILCGVPLRKSCDAIESPRLLQPASTHIEEENNFMDMDIFYITFIVSYIIVLLAIVAVLFINPYWRRAWFFAVETLMTSIYYFVVDHISRRVCG